MSTSCKIIEDLLPMYHDGVCSNESAAFIESHLNECAACRHVLASLRGEIELKKENPADDLKPLKGIQQQITKEKRRYGRKGAVITALLVAIIIPFLILGWNQYRQQGLHFSNISEYRVGNRFMDLVTKGNYTKAYQYINIDTLKQQWLEKWFDEETLENMEADGLAKFCEYGQKLEETGGIDRYEYIGITLCGQNFNGNSVYRLIYKVQLGSATQTFHIDVSQDGVDHIGSDTSFHDDPLAQFSIWSEYLWQDYEGCYFDPDLNEYVYYDKE